MNQLLSIYAAALLINPAMASDVDLESFYDSLPPWQRCEMEALDLWPSWYFPPPGSVSRICLDENGKVKKPN